MDKTAEKFLMAEYKALSKESWTNISLINDNILEWSVALIVLNPDSLYYGGYFKAKMTFPKNYPYSPP
ncbi:Ubiquitin-conjugating enzyme subunit, partial [Cryomyces antarcticus]